MAGRPSPSLLRCRDAFECAFWAGPDRVGRFSMPQGSTLGKLLLSSLIDWRFRRFRGLDETALHHECVKGLENALVASLSLA